MKKTAKKLVPRIFAGLLLLLSITVSSQDSSDKSPRDSIIRVAALGSNPLSFHRSLDIETGFENEILQAFASEIGYQIEFSSKKSKKEIISSIKKEKYDIGIGRFSNFDPTFKYLDKSSTYDTDKTDLVCRSGQKIFFDEDDQLSKNNRWILTVNSESAEQRWISAIRVQAPKIQVQISDTPIHKIAQKISKKVADCTLMSHLEASMMTRVYPQLKVVREISLDHKYFFILGNDSELNHKLQAWLSKNQTKKNIAKIRKSYSDLSKGLSEYDFRDLQIARNEVLPKLLPIFKKHSNEFKIPYALTVALSYQESKWNHEAVSFTGVKGIMQITNETLQFLGISEKDDLDSNIWGGIKYLRYLYDRVPKSISKIDRLSIALATYNIGPGHIMDAQNLAIKLGKNPYLWRDLSTVLPLLAKEKYQPLFKYGRARGYETVDFVEKVFTYYNILKMNI